MSREDSLSSGVRAGYASNTSSVIEKVWIAPCDWYHLPRLSLIAKAPARRNPKGCPLINHPMISSGMRSSEGEPCHAVRATAEKTPPGYRCPASCISRLFKLSHTTAYHMRLRNLPSRLCRLPAGRCACAWPSQFATASGVDPQRLRRTCLP